MSSLTRQLYGPTPSINKFTTPVPIDKGGTGGVTPTEAVVNLGGIALSKANVANGWPRLEADLTLDASLFPVESQGGVTINGPLSLLITNTGLFKITNYDSEHVYTVTADHGFVAQSGDTIYYTAPTTAGEYGFVVDGKVIPVTVSSHFVTQPSVVTPVNTQASISNAVLTDTLYADDRAINDAFGRSVAISTDGSRLAVGAYTRDVSGIADAGQVYIYTRSGSTWVEEATLIASDPTSLSGYGTSLAFNSEGSRLVVGAYTKTVSAIAQAGQVYIYIRSGSTWVLESTLVAADKANSDWFGISVAMDSEGSRLAIGAMGKTVSAVADAGQVYIYTRSGSTWTQEATVSASDKAADDWFGASVALSADGSRLAVGAYKKDVSSVVDAGQVYICSRVGSTWTQTAIISANDKATSDYFGISVALAADGTRLAIGAYSRDISGLTDAGQVYIYTQFESTWVKEYTFTANNNNPNDQFGSSVAFTGDSLELLVGSHNSDSPDVSNCGSVSTYSLEYANQSLLRQPSIVDFTSSPFALSGQYLESTLTASDRTTGDRFGVSVAVTSDGSRMAVGADYKDVSGVTDAGQVYIYVKSGSIWVEEATLSASDRVADDRFGTSVSITSDGTRVAVGSSLKTVSGITAAGKVYIYTRTGSVWTEEATLSAADRAANDLFGFSVALTADGSRLAVGACGRDVSSLIDAGKVYIYVRSGFAWIEESTLTASDKLAYDNFGSSVALTADGSRLVVGAFAKDVSGVTGAGKVYIYTRSGSVWTEESTLSASDKATDDYFGTAVTITADGSRLAVGSQNKDVSGTTDAGKVYMYTRSGSVWTLESTITAPDIASGDKFGESIAFTANGAVLAVGALYKDYTADLYNTGQVYTYLMSYHLGTDWQLATDPGFVNIIDSVTASVDDKLSWQVTDLVEGTDYYVRCRHLGSTYGYSDWSPIHKFTTKDMYIPSIEIGTISASDKAASDVFSSSISFNSDATVMVIGASNKTVGGVANAGKVYTFIRSGSTWIEESIMTADTPTLNDYFGRSVALTGDGTRLAVGTPGRTVSGVTNCGTVFIFTRSGSEWVFESSLAASDKAANDSFGISCSMDHTGYRLAVGAHNSTITGTANAGKVYVYTRSGSNWVSEAILTAYDKASQDYYGVSVSFNKDAVRIAIGSWLKDVSGTVDAGKVYIYTRSGTTWTLEAEVTASDKATNDQFGISLCFDENADILAIGAINKDVSGVTDAGQVYVFTRTGSTYTLHDTISASDKVTGSGFGSAIALDHTASLLAIGCQNKTVSGVTAAGAAYIFK